MRLGITPDLLVEGRNGEVDARVGDFRQFEIEIKIALGESPDVFEVAGRGELQIGVLIETMRREGYEFSVSRPEIITREVEGKTGEPVEDVVAEGPVDELVPEVRALIEHDAGHAPTA